MWKAYCLSGLLSREGANRWSRNAQKQQKDRDLTCFSEVERGVASVRAKVPFVVGWGWQWIDPLIIRSSDSFY